MLSPSASLGEYPQGEAVFHHARIHFLTGIALVLTPWQPSNQFALICAKCSALSGEIHVFGHPL